MKSLVDESVAVGTAPPARAQRSCHRTAGEVVTDLAGCLWPIGRTPQFDLDDFHSLCWTLSTVFATVVRMTSGLLPRRALGVVDEHLRNARVVIVNGARQSGKSELLRLVHAAQGGRYVSLDATADLRLARTDPTGLIESAPRPLVIDEVQRGGDPLVLAIKAAVDADRSRGQFLLAGSTRFLVEPRLSESLAGRARFVDLWPLSQGEIDEIDGGDRFIDAVFDRSIGDLVRAQPAPETRTATMARLVRGGFPEAVLATTDRARAAFFRDYVRTVSQRDITELSRMTQRVDFATVLRLVAARTAGELNVTSIANDAGIGGETARRYLPLLEAVFMVWRLPAWSTNLTSKVARRPKIHLVDAGLAAALTGASVDALARPGNPHAGALLETMVACELAKQATWSNTDVRLHHWRDRNGREIDLVLERTDGTVVGIEVKAAHDVTDADSRHLAWLRDQLGDRFAAGVVVHLGDRARPWGDRIASLPITALWATAL